MRPLKARERFWDGTGGSAVGLRERHHPHRGAKDLIENARMHPSSPRSVYPDCRRTSQVPRKRIVLAKPAHQATKSSD